MTFHRDRRAAFIKRGGVKVNALPSAAIDGMCEHATAAIHY